MGMKLKIESREDWLNLMGNLQDGGLLKDVSKSDISLSEDAFPLEVPFDISGLTAMLTNPMVKPFKKRIDCTLKNTLCRVIG